MGDATQHSNACVVVTYCWDIENSWIGSNRFSEVTHLARTLLSSPNCGFISFNSNYITNTI